MFFSQIAIAISIAGGPKLKIQLVFFDFAGRKLVNAALNVLRSTTEMSFIDRRIEQATCHSRRYHATRHDPERPMARYFQQTVQDYLELKASELHEVAETLPWGDEKEGLLRRARRMAAASDVIDRWLASPGLRAPR